MGSRFTYEPGTEPVGLMPTVAYASVWVAEALADVTAEDLVHLVRDHRANPDDPGHDLDKLVAMYVVIGDHVSRLVETGGWMPEDNCGRSETAGMTLASIATRWRVEPAETRDALHDYLATIDREDAWVGLTYALAAMRRLYSEVGTLEVDG